ncbi:MAG: flagellar hook-basal body complex protein FliE [Armatimonadota bacterium]|nr:flagellar hook-basal body complex protein FliE [Armatimonadota bacterium]
MRIDTGSVPLPIRQPHGDAAMPLSGPRPLAQPARPVETDAVGGGFATLLREALHRVNESQQAADLAVERVATGRAEDLHEAVIALEKADLTLRLTAQVTQRAVEAYKEISRMQL